MRHPIPRPEYQLPAGFEEHCMAGETHIDLHQLGANKARTRVVFNLGEERQLMRWPLAGGGVLDFTMEPGSFIAGQDPSFQQDYHALMTKGGLRLAVTYKI